MIFLNPILPGDPVRGNRESSGDPRRGLRREPAGRGERDAAALGRHQQPEGDCEALHLGGLRGGRGGRGAAQHASPLGEQTGKLSPSCHNNLNTVKTPQSSQPTSFFKEAINCRISLTSYELFQGHIGVIVQLLAAGANPSLRDGEVR